LQRIVLPDPEAPIPSSHAFNLDLINVLLGRQLPTWRNDIPPTIASLDSDVPPERGRDVEWLGENLNDSQKEAIRFCLKAEHVACIHGPPGVG
jgi:DNA polymerase alpha-associated DNA helicase A